MASTMLLSLFVILSTCFDFSQAQSVQDDWQSPASGEIWHTGQSYKISWDSNLYTWFGDYCPSCDTANVDLWATGTQDNYYKIASGINVHTTLLYDWTIPSSYAADEWALRFIPSGVNWKNEDEQISSNLFYTENSSTTTSSSASPMTSGSAPPTTGSSSLTTTSATTSSTPSGTTTMGPSTPAQSNSTNSTSTSSSGTTQASKLSTGAQAGIGVGAGVGALLLIALGFLLADRRRQHKREVAPQELMATNRQSNPSTAYDGNPPPWYQHSPNGHNVGHYPGTPFAEMSPDGHGAVELPETKHSVAELPDTK
ncbi:hypothetical protein F5Y16DRAFT_405002 [Xylariaceae sp. FL0255]|nr:hypothetical protein F5Y16DRAFT_405002 [Xylariaceae sp. FL0255]